MNIRSNHLRLVIRVWEISDMAEAPGTHVPPGPILTREVRWFQDGPLPVEIVAWFAGGQFGAESEVRVDDYDGDGLRQGVGVKRRNGKVIDAKCRILHEDHVTLAPEVRGCVEEWLKVSGPRNDIPFPAEGESIRVSKQIISRRFDLASRNGVVSGCDVELAEVTVGDSTAWSLCFETYGDLALRSEALEEGIRHVLDGSRPGTLKLGARSSCGYPAWLSNRLTG